MYVRLVQDKGSGGPLAPNFNKRSFQVNFLAPNDHPNLYLEQALSIVLEKCAKKTLRTKVCLTKTVTKLKGKKGTKQ